MGNAMTIPDAPPAFHLLDEEWAAFVKANDFACHGGCPKDRFIETPDGEPGLNYLCPGFKDFFHHIDEPVRIMGRLLAENRAPSEIVRYYAAEDAKRGRNDPCTCGCRRKWKNCHGGAAS